MSIRKGVLALALLLAAGPLMATEEDEGGAPLSDSRFSVHGEFRLRGELQENYQDYNDDGGFDDPIVQPGGQIDDDTVEFFPYRIRLAMLGHITEHVYGQVEIQVGDLFGEDEEKQDLYQTEEDAGHLVLYTGFVHWDRIGGTNWNSRLGRQEFTQGNEFLFGDFDYYNGVSFDGWRASFDGDPITFDFFWAQETESLGQRRDSNLFATNIDGSVDRGDTWSFWAGWIVQEEHHSGEDQLNLLTIGARWTRWEGEGSHFLWNAEIAYQDGRTANPRVLVDDLTAPDYGAWTGETDNDIVIVAWGAEGAFGYNIAADNSSHKIYGHVYYATGDEDGGREDEAFRPMYQDIHRRLGKADIVQGTNVTSYGIAWEGMFAGKHEAGVDLMAFIINEPDTDDTCLALGPGSFPLNDRRNIGQNCYLDPDNGFQGIFIPAGDRLSGIDPDEDDLGQEIDLWYTYHMREYLSFGVEVSAFFPGDAVTQLTDANEFEAMAPDTSAFNSSHAPTRLAAQTQFLLSDDPAYRLAAQVRVRF